MHRKSLDTKGFGFIGVLVVIVVLAIIAGAGVYMYHEDHKTKTLTSNTNSKRASSQTSGTSNTAATNPYAGWNSYTTKYSKISFKYPTSWTLTDTSDNPPDTDVTPGGDQVILTSESGLEVSIGTGATEFDSGNSTVQVVSATPLTMLGGTYYLVFTSTGLGLVTTADAVPTLSNLPTSKNVRLANPDSGSPTPFDLIDLEYSGTEGSDVHYPVSKFQQDPNYADALKILESMSY